MFYFCFVLAKSNIWGKQITAVFLLLVLFAVNSIQVSHIHSTGSAPSNKNKSTGYSACETLSSNNSCFICDYQLTKDADNCSAAFFTNHPADLHITAAATYSFTAQTIYPVFETRGPPVA